MNKNVISILLLVMLSFVAPAAVKAQQISSISGKVVNATNEPLMGNVMVLSAIDSSLLKGASFQSANFELQGINQKAVLLEVNFSNTAF